MSEMASVDGLAIEGISNGSAAQEVAVKPPPLEEARDRTTLSPPATLTESGRHVVLTNEKVEAERRRFALAPTFDRLIESNLALVGSVRTLVRAIYFLAAANAISIVASWWLHR